MLFRTTVLPPPPSIPPYALYAFDVKAKKENKVSDDCAFHIGYVEGRVQPNIVK